MATLAQVEQALTNAHLAGDMNAARVLAVIAKKERAKRSTDPLFGIPDVYDENTDVQGTVEVKQDPTLGEQVIGAGEAALTTGTAATTGAAGFIGATLKNIANEMMTGDFGTQESARRVEEAAIKGMQDWTYIPKTEAGQDIVQTIGEAVEPLVAVAPLSAEMQAIGAASRSAAPIGKAVAQERVIAPAAKAVTESVEKISQPKTTPGTGTAVGAQAVDKSVIRQTMADELPVKMQYTEGQKTRDFDQLRFERETAKLEDVGEPIRERYREQNEKLQQNMDAFIDSTGAELTDLRGVGEVVDKALRNRAARDKKKIRALYKTAEKSGEMEAPIALEQFAKHLTDNVPEAEVANVLKAVQMKAKQLGAVIESGDEFIAQPIPLKTAELLRKSINNVTDQAPPNIRQSKMMKDLIDLETEGLGGDAYAKARKARTRYAKDYENIGLIKQLLNTKRGTDDRAVAMEDVLRKSIIAPSSSLDTVRQLRRLLQTEGDAGKQAWKELQGGTLRHIKDEALKNVATNEAGSRMVSPSQLDRTINQLDKSGKLDFIFGKSGAGKIRLLNDVAKEVLTAPPGVINTSNTATVLAGLVDIAISGTAGIPAPIMSSFRLATKSIKDAKLRARVIQALGD
ncbi:MAG: hypothetical protein GY774_36215 [Planctomycetes bacterium]|nr:hypothetical protein [Planctomycetota bacterium]